MDVAFSLARCVFVVDPNPGTPLCASHWFRLPQLGPVVVVVVVVVVLVLVVVVVVVVVGWVGLGKANILLLLLVSSIELR
jgi:hypothetical protein